MYDLRDLRETSRSHGVQGGIIDRSQKYLRDTKLTTTNQRQESTSFLRSVTYHRQFKWMFAIIRPLYALLKNDEEFEWTTACQQTFELVKTSNYDTNISSSELVNEIPCPL